MANPYSGLDRPSEVVDDFPYVAPIHTQAGGAGHDHAFVTKFILKHPGRPLWFKLNGIKLGDIFFLYLVYQFDSTEGLDDWEEVRKGAGTKTLQFNAEGADREIVHHLVTPPSHIHEFELFVRLAVEGMVSPKYTVQQFLNGETPMKREHNGSIHYPDE